MADVADIPGRWTTALGQFGAILERLPELHQSIRTIVATQKGSVPHDPSQGVDWLAQIDRPASIAVPVIALDIRQQLKRYEPRINVKRVLVVPQAELGKYRTEVYWVPAEGGTGTEERTVV